MDITIVKYTKDRIQDVIDYELKLREEESWGWDIDDEYKSNIIRSFDDDRFKNSLSLLAYVDNIVVGRIDSTLICSHFDGSIKAYLDWICVLKDYRHNKIAQKLMAELRKQLKDYGVTVLVGIVANNEEVLRFYNSLENKKIKDKGIWIDL